MPDHPTDPADIPERCARYRAAYRQTEIPRRYNGWLHIGLSSVAAAAAFGAAFAALDPLTPLQWLTLPAAFLVANAAEYFGHKGPMHRRVRFLERMCFRHAGQHHRFFTEEAMVIDDARDFHIILFPAVMLGFFLGLIATPIAIFLFVVVGKNVGLLFVMTAAAYLITYEWLHLIYHLNPTHPLGRLPGVAFLRRHHQIHHDPGAMAKLNFNISFPVFDALLGTMERRGRAERTASTRRSETTPQPASPPLAP